MEFLVSVDLDNTRLEINAPSLPAWAGVLNGHTLEVKNGPGGCVWNSGTYVMTCEILFRNLDSDECMTNVRTRFHSSTNPTAVMDQVDYNWIVPGVSYNPVSNTAQPINNSGYCITDNSPSSLGSAEGCANTWQESIPPGAVATQKFLFTNVTSGSYQFYLQVFADYQACPAPPGMKMIPAGCFSMGDAFSEGQGDELPVHSVCITSGFYLDQHEVTNAEYSACVGAAACLPPDFSSSASRASYYGNSAFNEFPVIYVNWNKARAYCSWLGKRLPTEAEWEFAARSGGGSERRYPNGTTLTGADANFIDSGDPWDNDTSTVGYFPPNDFGLEDMTGNVWEWINDRYAADYYSSSPGDDPGGSASGVSRVVRGGSFGNGPSTLRLSERANFSEDTRGSLIGFRCAMTK